MNVTMSSLPVATEPRDESSSSSTIITTASSLSSTAESSNNDVVAQPHDESTDKEMLAAAAAAAVVPKKEHEVGSCSTTGGGPQHLLMFPSPDSKQEQLLQKLLCDDKMKVDYLALRYKALYPDEAVSQDVVAKEDVNGQNKEYLLWSGATVVERALVGCCELPNVEDESDIMVGMPSYYFHRFKDSSALSWEAGIGGLQRGKETYFVGLLAKCCHTVGSRALALAILYRSIELDEEDREDLSDDDVEDDNEHSHGIITGSSPRGNKGDHVTRNSENTSRRNKESIDSTPMATRRSKRKQDHDGKAQDSPAASPPPASKRPRREAAAKKDYKEMSPEQKKSGATEEDPSRIDRLKVFVSSGGLRILRTWLTDAVTPVTKVVPVQGKKRHADKNPSGADVFMKKKAPSPFGPILLPLLGILESMPIDKKTIVESRINRDIRRLSKQVNGLVDSFRQDQNGKEKSAVMNVQVALNSLMEKWEMEVKMQPKGGIKSNKNSAPFEQLKSQLRKRVAQLKRYESGETAKPTWFKETHALADGKEFAQKMSDTDKLAARERHMERAALKDRLLAAQEERKKHLQRFHELRNRQNQRTMSRVTKKTKKGVSVRWKDGLFDAHRQKHLLEEVFVLQQEDVPDDNDKDDS